MPTLRFIKMKPEDQFEEAIQCLKKRNISGEVIKTNHHKNIKTQRRAKAKLQMTTASTVAPTLPKIVPLNTKNDL